MPSLSIVIPTFNRAQYLQENIRLIQENACDHVHDIEVLVSDNASDDNTEQVVRIFDVCIRYYRNAYNLGPVENTLQACERASGNFVLLMSDDDLLYRDSLPRLLDSIHRMPWVGVIASPVTVFENRSPDRMMGKLQFPGGTLDIVLRKGRQAVSGILLRATSFSGLVIRRDLLDIGGARKHARSLYPQMYLAGYAAKKADVLYLTQPLVKIRVNPVKHWNYSGDFMAGAVLDILKDLTRDEPWGREVQKEITRKRILATYGPLYSSRDHSWESFIQTARGFSTVQEYRKSFLFWCFVLGIGLLGAKGIERIRKIWRGPVIDRII